MPESTENFAQGFYRDDTQAWVTCRQGKCRADVALNGRHENINKIRLEILLQPRDENGWPAGSPRQLLQTDVVVVPDPAGKSIRGSVLLPQRLTPLLLRQSHLRLTVE